VDEDIARLLGDLGHGHAWARAPAMHSTFRLFD
jgi:hypothetical protein